MLIGLYLVVGLTLLYFGAEWLVKGGVRIAAAAKVSPLLIGLTLIAFATSAPEMVVSLDAAFRGSGDISIGNIMGSNICNIALILGVSALFCPLVTSTQILRFDAPLMIGITFAFVGIFLFFGGVGRVSGGVLFSGLIIYTVWSIIAARRDEKKNKEVREECETEVIGIVDNRSWKFGVVQAAAGLTALIIGGKLLVDGAVDMANALNISDAVIGLTVIAVGTSLPELATSVVAAMHKQRDIAIGNVIGSNIFNILGIMGVVGLVHPVSAAGIKLTDIVMLLLCSILILPMMRTGYTITRREGIILLLLYAGYTGWLIYSI